MSIATACHVRRLKIELISCSFTDSIYNTATWFELHIKTFVLNEWTVNLCSEFLVQGSKEFKLFHCTSCLAYKVFCGILQVAVLRAIFVANNKLDKHSLKFASANTLSMKCANGKPDLLIYTRSHLTIFNSSGRCLRRNTCSRVLKNKSPHAFPV